MSLVEKIAGSLKSFGVNAAYGDLVQLNGRDVLPVAIVGYGFGGSDGTGTDEGAQGNGGGAGGGGWAVPIGAYVTKGDGRVSFEPNLIAVLAVGIPLVTSVGFAVAAILRRHTR